MGTYLSIVAGAIKLFNAIAQALQQHHDELNGATAQRAGDQDARTAELARLTAPVGAAESNELWNTNKAKFGPAQPGDGKQQ